MRAACWLGITAAGKAWGLLIWAGSDRDPGRYYTYDRQSRRLNEIMLSRPQLEGVELAEVRAVTYRARDGAEIPAYLTLPPGSSGRRLPAIVMPYGGPDIPRRSRPQCQRPAVAADGR